MLAEAALPLVVPTNPICVVAVEKMELLGNLQAVCKDLMLTTPELLGT